MRRYGDEIDVGRGLVAGDEAPASFRWHGRTWRVRAVLGHWVRTGAWWVGDRPGDLLAEQEVWRVEAAPRRPGKHVHGVFDLVFCWDSGRWRLERALD